MPTIKVVVPASITNIGPGVDTLGIAVTLHNTIELRLETGKKDATPQPIKLTVTGENHFPVSDEHPVCKAVRSLYEEAKLPIPGLTITCVGEIVEELGEKSAWVIGGLMAANNLLPTPLKREQIVALACRVSPRLRPPRCRISPLRW